MKMGGGAKPFGVDAERVPALARRIIAAGAEWRGFHIFAGSQALDADAIAETQAQTLELAARLAEESGAALPHCNLGGGFGIPYFPGDEAARYRQHRRSGLASNSPASRRCWPRPASASSWAAIWLAKQGFI